MNKNIIIGVLIALLVIAGVAFFVNKNETSTEEVIEHTSTQTDTTSNTPTDTSSGTDVSVGVGVSTGAVKEFTVTAKNFSFSPTTMTVNKGDRVKITFINSEGFHDLVVDGYNVRTKQIQAGKQEVIEFTADKAGTFEYYCSVGTHRQMGMKGTLTVK